MTYGLTNVITYSQRTMDPVVGTTRLFTSVNAPAGVLLRRITSFAEAVDCGGLLLVNSAGKWVFYVGETLLDVLSNSLLGKFVCNPSGLIKARPNPDITRTTKWIGDPVYSDGTARRTLVHTGGEVEMVLSYDTYFSAGDTIDLWGVVTAATRGHGVSHGVSRRGDLTPLLDYRSVDGYSYMATDTEMRVTLARYLADQKGAFLAGLPSNVAGFYAAVYDQVAAMELSKPKLAATTVWKNGVLSQIPVTGSRILFTQVADVWQLFGTSSADTFGKVPDPYPHWPGFDATMPVNAMYSGNIPATPYFTWQPAAGTTAFTESHKPIVLRNALGAHMPETPLLPSMCRHHTDNVRREVTPASGSIGPYQVGALRDAHVMARRMVSGLEFESAVSAHPDLGSYVNATVTNAGASAVIDFDAFTTPARVAQIVSDTDALADMRPNVFSAGELPISVNKFCSRLDDAAKAHAEANS